ncbi:MAG: DUF5714 domain-containing protein, partial [Candidatus Thorarchaeota archaeon]
MSKHQTDHNMACMICGTTLVYDSSAHDQKCIYCGNIESSAIYCPDGHFVCDSCHSQDAISFLEILAETDTSTNPMDVVDKAFAHPSFKFHGPEHHSLVPAAILIALKNRGIPRKDGSPITFEVILEGIRRGSKIPGGFCGYAGTCGGCVGAGVAVALYVVSTPTKGNERRFAHAATSDALYLSQDGLRRCCKRATYYGITAAMKLLKNDFNIDLGEIPKMESCKYSEKNRDCEYEDCIY